MSKASERLAKQIDFFKEIDKLKRVERRTLLTERVRYENSAEHSWHLAVTAMLLSEYALDAERPLDQMRVLKMIIVHDLVEIDAGDTFVYDDKARSDQADREKRAADRIFAMLPHDQGTEIRELWEEFEARATAEAQFAAALDRLQPLLLNFFSEGSGWQKNGVLRKQVEAINRPAIEKGAPQLWEFVRGVLDEAVERGFLKT